MQISIIGVGMSHEKNLQLSAKIAIDEADIIIGSRRILEDINTKNVQSFNEINPEKIEVILRENIDKKIAVLMSGDTGFFSGSQKLIERISDLNYTLYAGISSVSYLASKILKPWHNLNIVSLHGKNNYILGNILAEKESFFLLDKINTAEKVIKTLCENNMGDSKVYVGEKLSYPDEKITIDIAQNLLSQNFDELSVIWVERREIFRDSGSRILDNQFIRDKIPMTKSQVRAVICDYFNLKNGDCIQDIGAGTGSISVSIAVKNPFIKVTAIEINRSAVELICENIKKFDAYNIDVIEGEASEKLKEINVANHAFIGGSKGNLEEIIDVLLQKNPKINILVSAVTVETFNECVQIFKEKFQENVEILQISVSKSQKLGNYNMLKAENPIFLIGRRYE